jgi:hypothetical protein
MPSCLNTAWTQVQPLASGTPSAAALAAIEAVTHQYDACHGVTGN